MKVYVTGHGLVPFRATNVSKSADADLIQLRGQYKLPKGSRLTNGKKWVDLDYWFTLDQIEDIVGMNVSLDTLHDPSEVSIYGEPSIEYGDCSNFR